MAAYCWVDGLKSHAGRLPVHRDHLQISNARKLVWENVTLNLFTTVMAGGSEIPLHCKYFRHILVSGQTQLTHKMLCAHWLWYYAPQHHTVWKILCSKMICPSPTNGSLMQPPSKWNTQTDRQTDGQRDRYIAALHYAPYSRTQTVPTTTKEISFSGNMNAALCDLEYVAS